MCSVAVECARKKTCQCRHAQTTHAHSTQWHIQLRTRVWPGNFGASIIEFATRRPLLEPPGEHRVSRTDIPSWYIRMYIRGTLGHLRVHSEYNRCCSTAAAYEKGQIQLVHSEVHSRYIRVHSGTFGVHSSLQRGGRDWQPCENTVF